MSCKIAAKILPSVKIILSLCFFLSPCLTDPPLPAMKERPLGCKTIFVGGLPKNATEQLILEAFGKGYINIRFAKKFTVDKALLSVKLPSL